MRFFHAATATGARPRSALASFVVVALLAGVALPVVVASRAWAEHGTLSISDASRPEGNSRSAPATFTVTLSAVETALVAVDYSTTNGTATAGADYTATSGTVAFSPGETSKTVTVQVTGDTLDEDDETFTVNLVNPTNATVADAQGVGTIIDDDDPPRLSIDNGTPNPATESAAGPVGIAFTATLSAPSALTVTAGYATADGTATAGADYTATSGTLTFTPGQTSATVTVAVLDDATDESNETFFVNLSAPLNATISDAQGVGTIVDDDGPPALSIGDATVSEGDAGATNAVFTVTLAPASAKTVAVGYSTANGTATAGSDYTATSGTLTFAPGTTTASVTVPVLGDTADEPDEVFRVNLAATATNAVVADGQGVGTITDDDAGSVLSITDQSALEGTAGATAVIFTVSLTPASAQPVSVAYATADGTAVAPADYVPASGVLTFAAGQTAKTITVDVVGDVAAEPNETFFVDLSAPVNATIGDDRGEGTIVNDDGPPSSLSIGDTTVTEGSSGTVNASFTVTLSPSATQTVTVGYATSNGTAVTPADYVAAAGSLVFAPGDSAKVVTVAVNGDALDEDDETFFVNLVTPLNASIADGQGQATVTDDDEPPSLSISDVAVLEGDLFTTNATVAVSLSAASGRTVTVAYATADATATAGSDYTATTGTLTFVAGETTKSVSAAVVGDAVDEDDETFTVDLSGAVNASVADAQGQVTITDDDAAPSITVNDASLPEGDAGATTAPFTVTLSAASARTVTVAYATADATATAGSDYTATSGTLTFSPGETSKEVGVGVIGDVTDEPNETFTLDLSAPSNATIADAQGVGTIIDDDGPPTLSIDDVTVAEPDAGSTTAVFTVRLLPAALATVTVDYATADATATAGSDYTSTGGTLTFAAGETEKTIEVPVIGDTADEVQETFEVNLSAPSGATIADGQGIGTIVDNDDPPTLSIDDVTVTEGDSGTASAVFTVTRTGTTSQAVTVDFATSDGSAQAPGDYAATTGTLTFAASESTKTITVAVAGDVLDEDDETFFVNLVAPVNASIGDGEGQATVTDDDVAPTLSISDVAVLEGDVLTTNATMAVTLSAASGRTVTVAYVTTDATATAGSDYTATSGTLTFSPGETSKEVGVVVIGDVTDEPNETFTLDLSAPSNATIADAQGVGTIIDDDGPPTLSIDDVMVAETDAGSTTAVFTVRLLPAALATVTVDYATADATATAGSDYTSTGGTLTFAAGETEKTIEVPVIGDTADEVQETFEVNLSAPSGATIADGQGIGTIVDNDDAPPTLSIGDVTVTEGDSGTASAVFTVTRTGTTSQAVTVDFATSDGSARAPGDYAATTGTLTFAASESTKTITVAVAGDVLDEDDETFFVNLVAPVNASIGDGEGQATVTDDDAAPTLSINDVSVKEGASGSTSATFAVVLSSVSGKAVSVGYATVNGSATAPADYTATNGTLAIPAGRASGSITVPVRGDVLVEGNETFNVDLSSPVNATVARARGTGTIVDDDQAPTAPTAPARAGYWLVASDGGIFAFGDAAFRGSTGAITLNRPIVGMASTPSGNGYWLVASDGGIFAFGDAVFRGSTGAIALTRPIVGMASTPSGNGYWLVASDGGIFAFGDAAFRGSTGAIVLNRPIVGMASTPSGAGYWLVASDGGIFSFGDAAFRGSTGAIALTKPIVGMASTPSGNGYWLVASDGGIFSFGDAVFRGSTGAIVLNRPIVGMASTPSGAGYWLVASDGGIFSFGDAAFRGSTGAIALTRPIVGMGALLR